ncbi:hypothetical protein KDM41_05485 [bacterium]|nr:hypothetical protein [bacterium]
MSDIIFRAYNKAMQRCSNQLFRGVLDTPPMPTNPDAEAILYCALNQPNVRAYILAVKSYLRFHDDVAVVVQDDGSLTDASVAEIEAHLPGAIVDRRSDMFAGIARAAGPALRAELPPESAYDEKVPVKILYLKFFNVILRWLRGRKVVIIDSDLIFLRRPDEIISWCEAPYTHDLYGEGANAEADTYRKLGFTFESLDVADFSSGTLAVGGEVGDDELAAILRRINEQAPHLYGAWEIEQALWAIVMSRRPGPVNLDELRDVYIGSGWRSYRDLKENAVIAHFAGAIRFKNLRYLRLARELVGELKAGAGAGR